MSATDLLCLNRIIKPQIPLEEFLKFTADLSIKYVELRNDFTDKGILDGLSDAALEKVFKDSCIQAVTINALYPFEDIKVLNENLDKLKGFSRKKPRLLTFRAFSRGRPRQPRWTKIGFWLRRTISWITAARLRLCWRVAPRCRSPMSLFHHKCGNCSYRT
jgi:hypothetical protein